jgi:hypothetical protein
MSKLNRFQRFAVRRYDNGDGGYCQTTKDVEGYGDGLLRFLVVELSEQEGCDGYDEMVRRLNVVHSQIGDLIIRAGAPREEALLSKSKRG